MGWGLTEAKKSGRSCTLQDVGGVGGIGTRPSDGDKYTHAHSMGVYSVYSLYYTQYGRKYTVKYKHTMGGSADKKDWDNLGVERS